MEDVIKRRVMPHSDEAELAVIGSMLMDSNAIAIADEMLIEDNFYQRKNRELFKAMTRLYNDGEPCDLVTVTNKLKEMSVPEEIVGMDYLRKVVSEVVTSANVKQYAQIVADKATLRRLIKAQEESINDCYGETKPVAEILEGTEKNIFDITQTGNKDDVDSIQTIAFRVLDKIEESAKTSGKITGISTGFTQLDHRLAGLQPSDMILVAARPSVGKTAFVLNITENVAIKQNKGVVFFSCEMSSDQLANRLLAQNSMIDAQSLRTGNLEDSDWPRLVEAVKNIGSSNIIIDDTPNISVNLMRSRCRKWKREHKIDLIIVDYLQLMSASNVSKAGSREQEIAEISRTLKSLAREMNVPVIALSQLNRAVETREDRKPVLADLRESGSIEQDADVVMLLSRVYDRETKTEDRNRIIVNVAKQRNGSVGEQELVWLGQYTKFENPEEGHI